MSNILLFGDNTADQYPLLSKTCLRNKNALVVTFVEQSALVLREEIGKLPFTERKTFPDFLTMNDLIEPYYQKGLKLPQLESALVTIAQLGHYLG